MSEPLAVELQGAVRRYGRDTVLSGITLSVSQGRFVVIRGGNGSGKTTLLRLLATRLRLSGGSGSVFGYSLERQPAEVRRRVALLSVQGGSYPLLTAAENLELAARMYGLDGADVPALLDRVGLEKAGNRQVRGFSSGMKKRLSLARLLLPGARLWLLDEPFTTLDDDGRALVDSLVHQALADGITVLMATHEPPRDAAAAPDAVLLMQNGVLSRVGP